MCTSTSFCDRTLSLENFPGFLFASKRGQDVFMTVISTGEDKGWKKLFCLNLLAVAVLRASWSFPNVPKGTKWSTPCLNEYSEGYEIKETRRDFEVQTGWFVPTNTRILWCPGGQHRGVAHTVRIIVPLAKYRMKRSQVFMGKLTNQRVMRGMPLNPRAGEVIQDSHTDA